MLFPFRTSAIFRNRWVALLWAAGICFMASEIVDSVSGIADKGAKHSATADVSAPADRADDPVAAVLEGPPTPSVERPAL